jgi:hypothetical protein
VTQPRSKVHGRTLIHKVVLNKRKHFHSGAIVIIDSSSNTIDVASFILSLSDVQSTTNLLIKARPPKLYLLLSMDARDDIEDQMTTMNPSRTKHHVNGTLRQCLQWGSDIKDVIIVRPYCGIRFTPGACRSERQPQYLQERYDAQRWHCYRLSLGTSRIEQLSTMTFRLTSRCPLPPLSPLLKAPQN